MASKKDVLRRTQSSTRQLRTKRRSQLVEYEDDSWWGEFVSDAWKCFLKPCRNDSDEPAATYVLSIPYNEDETKESGRPDNYVTTTKYTWYTFVPKAMTLQFRRFANVFFLGIVILSTIGTYAPQIFIVSFDPWGTLLVLIFVIGVTMLFEGMDDYRRYKADRKMNNQKVVVISDAGIEQQKKWGTLRPGQVVRVMKGEEVPADILLCRTSFQDTGLCYVETSGIDGETNLKIKTVSKEMRHLIAEEGSSSAVKAVFEYEAPNSFLQFSGKCNPDNLQINPFPLEFSELVLRGSRVRNTAWVEGYVMYAGIETKLVLSSRDTPSKFSRIDTFVNRMLGVIFCLYLSVVVLSVILLILWVPNTSTIWYFQGFDIIDSFLLPGWLAYFFTFLGLYANFIPIDMYFCMELVNFMQGWLLTQDMEMYDEISDTRAGVRTGSLIAEIGQVTHIFSDKTGTLTANQMRLVSCSIGGKMYGFRPKVSPNPDQPMAAEAPPKIGVRELFRGLRREIEITPKDPPKSIDLFLSALALCHTVVIDYDDDKNIQYNAEGPDEEALVSAAAGLGYRLLSTENGSMQIKVEDTDRDLTYKVLAVNAFNSDRKRMSVILENQNEEIFLVMKGADNVMLERCRKQAENQLLKHLDGVNMFESVDDHLNVFSSAGLRTLVVGIKQIARGDFDTWFAEFSQARLAGANRKKALAAAAEKIETDLELLGVTAIEDALQEGVPETVKMVRDAGIRLWVLTGDKVQTAINISLSCNLLDSSMTILKLTDDFLENQNQDDSMVISEAEKKTLLMTALRNTLRSLDEVASPEKVPADQTSANGTKKDIEAQLPFASSPEKSANDSEGQPWEARQLALVMTGSILEYLLKSQKGDTETDLLLYQLASKCHVVVACRVSPIQKALIVRLVTENSKTAYEGSCCSPLAYVRRTSDRGEFPVTLAIGDGANDVAMIQEAKVGVGISGKEGLQAVNSADFSIAQFRFLRRLLLVHGRWNYHRTTTLVKYITYSWLVLAYILFFYMFYCMFSGQQIFFNFLYLTIYAWLVNSVIVAIAWFERDVSAATALANPICYQIGASNILLGYEQVLATAGRALLHSVVLLVVFFSSDPTIGVEQLGSVMFVSLVMLMTIRQLYLTGTVIWFTFLAYFLMFVLFIGGVTLLDLLITGIPWMFVNSAGRTVWLPAFWTTLTVLVLEYCFSGGKHVFFPSYHDILKERDRGYFDGNHTNHGIKDALHVATKTGQYLLLPAQLPAKRLKARLHRMESDSSFVFSAGDRKCKYE